MHIDIALNRYLRIVEEPQPKSTLQTEWKELQKQLQELQLQSKRQLQKIKNTEKVNLDNTSTSISVSRPINILPLGGRVRHFIKNWKKLKLNKFILQCLHGCKINFKSIPIQTSLPHQIKFNKTETEALNEKINDLLKEQMIEICSFEQGDFMNSVFLREKGILPRITLSLE